MNMPYKKIGRDVYKYHEHAIKIRTKDNMSYVYVKSPNFFFDEPDMLLEAPQEEPPNTPSGIIAYNDKFNKVFVYKIDRNAEEGDIEYKRVFRSVEKKVQQASDQIVSFNFKSLRGKMDEFKRKWIYTNDQTFCKVYDDSEHIFSFFLLNRNLFESDKCKNRVLPMQFHALIQFMMYDFIDKYVDIKTVYKSFIKKVRRNVMHTYNIVSISDLNGTNSVSFTETDGMPSFTFVFDYDTFFVYVYPYLSKSKINYDTVFNNAPFKPPFRLACLAEPSAFPLLMWVNNDTLMLKLEFLK